MSYVTHRLHGHLITFTVLHDSFLRLPTSHFLEMVLGLGQLAPGSCSCSFEFLSIPEPFVISLYQILILCYSTYHSQNLSDFLISYLFWLQPSICQIFPFPTSSAALIWLRHPHWSFLHYWRRNSPCCDDQPFHTRKKYVVGSHIQLIGHNSSP